MLPPIFWNGRGCSCDYEVFELNPLLLLWPQGMKYEKHHQHATEESLKGSLE